MSLISHYFQSFIFHIKKKKSPKRLFSKRRKKRWKEGKKVGRYNNRKFEIYRDFQQKKMETEGKNEKKWGEEENKKHWK